MTQVIRFKSQMIGLWTPGIVGAMTDGKLILLQNAP